MRIFIFALLLVTACNPYTMDDTDVYANLEKWKSFFEEDSSDTYYYPLTLIETDGNILITTHSCEDTCSLGLIEESVIQIDTSLFFSKYSDFSNIYRSDSRQIWKGESILVSHNVEAKHCQFWTIHDIRNKRKSSRINMDQDNNLWEAAENGLYRYDGKEWVSFYEGINIGTLCFNNNGVLYFSTLPDLGEKGVIVSYNQNEFDTIYVCNTENNWVPCINFDNSDNMWFGILSRSAVGTNMGGGLVKHDGELFENFNIYNSELSSNSVVEIDIDTKDNIWIGTYSGGISKIANTGEWKVYDKSNTPMHFASVDHIVVDDKQNVWFAIQFYGVAVMRDVVN